MLGLVGVLVGVEIGAKIVHEDKHLAVLIFPDSESQFSLLNTAVKLRIAQTNNFSGGNETDSLAGVAHRPDPRRA